VPSSREPGPGAAQPTESAKDSGHYRLASDPDRAARYRQAREKLRVGMQAMLDFYVWEKEREEAKHLSAEAVERMRVEARDHLLAQIANRDDEVPHKSMPQNELSDIAFWTLSEALESICTDERTYRDEQGDG